MKQNKKPHAESPALPFEEVRNYAYHLFVQRGRIPGRDLDDWLEAEACLSAHVPIEGSHDRPHPRGGRHASELLAAGPGG